MPAYSSARRMASSGMDAVRTVYPSCCSIFEAIFKIAELMAYAMAINLFLTGVEAFKEFYAGGQRRIEHRDIFGDEIVHLLIEGAHPVGDERVVVGGNAPPDALNAG